MLNVIVFIAIVGSGLALIVFGILIFMILGTLFTRLIDRSGNYALPDPDKAADRPWGQKYFERAIGRRSN